MVTIPLNASKAARLGERLVGPPPVELFPRISAMSFEAPRRLGIGRPRMALDAQQYTRHGGFWSHILWPRFAEPEAVY